MLLLRFRQLLPGGECVNELPGCRSMFAVVVVGFVVVVVCLCMCVGRFDDGL